MAAVTEPTAGFEAEAKQRPRTRVVSDGQAAACPPRKSALEAWVALTASGTAPSAERLMSEPVSEPLATLALLTAFSAIFPVVTDLDLSWREPTLFLPSWLR